MKKLLYFAGAMALMAGMVACGPEEGPTGPNLDEAVEVGFYVIGDAVGVTDIVGEAMMGAGYNENGPERDENGAVIDATTNKRGTNQLRSGMYEKYVWLEAGKDFEIVYFDGEQRTRYGAVLDREISKEQTGDGFPEDPQWGKIGELDTTESAPALQVPETGFYHIVLDDASNQEDKADFALIMVLKAKMSTRGDNNGWGNTYGVEARAEDGTITWTWAEQTFSKAGAKFKFAYNHGWKIALDLSGNIKCNTNLGWTSADDHKLLQGGADIVVDNKGIYTITLTYKMGKGAHGNSFTYNIEQTGTIETNVPDNLYIIGNEFGNWDWTSEGVVEMTRVNGGNAYWAVRYMTTATQFKFNSVLDWDGGQFCDLGVNKEGFITVSDNNQVEEDGLYLILVDYDTDKVSVTPANICGLGDAFGGWDATNAGQVAGTVNEDGTVTLTTTAAGLLRSFVKIEGVDAWKSEFTVLDGAIVYRGENDDFNATTATTVEAGKTVTYNFNAGTATIE
ncbi:MAG: SusF/SusE family outer membrane protein [Tidjanibacter sp.]|nr:SusF/SusE family outer membrane protein [Tidjanibacter sp.]